jgi:nucleoside-diphosphate kinase
MAIEQTLSIIKPDAVGKNLIGKIYARFEENGLRIVAAKMLHMTRTQAEDFYAIHKDRSFFSQLVEFMISGPVMVQVLEGENAITINRQLMGATSPKLAAPGTIRRDLAYDSANKESHENAVHGSDSPENANKEINFFFRPEELCRRTR